MTEQDFTSPNFLQNIKTKQMFDYEPPPILYHYTNYDGANGIITSSSLWLTHIRYLNDTSELHTAIDFIRQIAKRKADSIEDKERREFLTKTSNKLESFKEMNICVGSFSEDKDSLSQCHATPLTSFPRERGRKS